MSSSGYEGCGICKNADSVSFCKQILIEYVLEKSKWFIRGLYSPRMVCAALPRARGRDSPSDRFAEWKEPKGLSHPVGSTALDKEER